MDERKMSDLLSEEILSWAVARLQSELKTETSKKVPVDSKAVLRILQSALRQAAELAQVLHWKTFEVKS